MITNKDIRVDNGNLVINGDKYPLDGQSPETIMQIVEDNSDTTPTESSDAPITSGGVYTALGTKQDTLTFDSAPTDESTNPVTSGGLYNTIGDLTQTGVTGATVAAQVETIKGLIDGIRPSAGNLAGEVLTLSGTQDDALVFKETGTDDYKGMSFYDKDNNLRYKLYMTGGHLKFLSKAADGTTIVDTTIA